MDERTVADGVDVESFDALVESLNVPDYEDAAVAEARAAAQAGAAKPVACWAHRGCEGLMGLSAPMEDECPHSRSDCYAPCPEECKYTACRRPWHRTASDFNLILDPTVDRMAAIKRSCYSCEYFLKNGPRLDERGPESRVVPEQATKESDGSVTIHLF